MFNNVVKTSVFLKDMEDFAAMNKIYAEYFKTEPPARACVQVARLPRDVSVEIEVIAVYESKIKFSYFSEIQPQNHMVLRLCF